jgi:hypothetical protein
MIPDRWLTVSYTFPGGGNCLLFTIFYFSKIRANTCLLRCADASSHIAQRQLTIIFSQTWKNILKKCYGN